MASKEFEAELKAAKDHYYKCQDILHKAQNELRLLEMRAEAYILYAKALEMIKKAEESSKTPFLYCFDALNLLIGADHKTLPLCEQTIELIKSKFNTVKVEILIDITTEPLTMTQLEDCEYDYKVETDYKGDVCFGGETPQDIKLLDMSNSTYLEIPTSLDTDDDTIIVSEACDGYRSSAHMRYTIYQLTLK